MLELRDVSGRAVVTVEVPVLQTGNSEEFKELMAPLLDSTTGPFVVDLSAVTFIGSTGIGVLAGAIRATRDQGRTLHVVTPRKTVQQMLRMVRFTDFEHVFVWTTLEEALAHDAG